MTTMRRWSSAAFGAILLLSGGVVGTAACGGEEEVSRGAGRDEGRPKSGRRGKRGKRVSVYT